MGRGRAKAKQTKVARALKYGGPQTDLQRLQAELSGSQGQDSGRADDVVEDPYSGDPYEDDPYAEDPYAKYYEDDSDDEDSDEVDSAADDSDADGPDQGGAKRP